MFRDRDEELRRLEEALLEEEEEEKKRKIEDQIEEERRRSRWKEDEEDEEEEEEYEDDEEDEDDEDDLSSYQPEDTDSAEIGTFRNFANNYRAYNSDRVDVDLDEYSEQVRNEPKGGSCLLRLLLMLLCGILVMLILFLLKYQGIL